jgi:PAS domain S-box-containing protein
MSDPGKDEAYRRLTKINRAISGSLNFEEILDTIVESAAQLVDANVSAVLITGLDGQLRIGASRGLDEKLVGSFSAQLNENVIDQLRRSLNIASTSTLVALPITEDKAPGGLLVITRDTPVTPEEEWRLSTVADQAAIALRNALFYEMALSQADRERDETMEALRESNEKIRNILETITDLYYTLDREWRFTEVNRQTEIRFQKSREELIGGVIWELYPAAIDSSVYTNFHRAVKEMVPVHFEVQSRLIPNIWFEVHAYPSAENLTVFLRDISERRTAELTSHLLAAIVESSEDAIISKDLDGIISSWNKGAQRIFGYSAEEVLGQPITILVPQDRYEKEVNILHRIREGQSIEYFETVRQRKDGSLIDVSLSISPIKDEAGVIVGASTIARDISEQKRREKESHFQSYLLGAVEQAVIATDLEGKILFWNSFAERLYGWSAAEAIGANVLELVPASGMQEVAAEILSRIRKGESWSGEFSVKRKDGSVFPALVTDSPIFDSKGELIGVIGISIDITDRKRAEEERTKLLESEREARSEAEQANRLKDQFLATLSHELRNPLNVILGYSEVLLRSKEGKESEFVKRAAETLRRNALAQSQLVSDLLDLSRLHMGKLALNKEPISLTTTIKNAVDTVRVEAGVKDIELIIDVPEEPLYIYGDPLRMEQVIWNLLNNAVKFTPLGGAVTTRLRSEGREAVLTVEDTGQGIEPAFLPHVFEMFRQADATSSRQHGGMGIGLALVQQLVQLQDGSISLFSEGQGKGAEFTLRLPLSNQGRDIIKASIEIQPGALDHMRILVVDDSLDTVDMLRRLFEMDGAEVNTARGGAEALEILSREKFDVILSDISMPGMDGFELLRRLRKLPENENVPVLALTGFGRAEDVERAIAEGFFSHVTKPIDLAELVEILQNLNSPRTRETLAADER